MRPLGVFFLAICFVFLFSRGVYDRWIDTQSVMSFSDVASYGQESTITQTLAAQAGKRLVPEGSLRGINDVDSMSYEYSVIVTEGETLNVSAIASIHRDNVAYLDSYGLIQFEIEVEMVSSTLARVIVTVSLRMPQTEAEYDFIQGSQASFNVSFDQTKAE